MAVAFSISSLQFGDGKREISQCFGIPICPFAIMSVPTPKHFNIQYSLTYIRLFVDHVRAGNVAQATRMLKLHPELANVRIHLDNRKTVLMEALTSAKANEMVPLLLAKGAHLAGKNTQREDTDACMRQRRELQCCQSAASCLGFTWRI